MFVNVLDFVWNNFFIISILVMLILYIINLKVLICFKNMIIFINFEFIGICLLLSNEFFYDYKILLFFIIIKIDCFLFVVNLLFVCVFY